MREIKFRAWNEELKRMAFSDDVHFKTFGWWGVIVLNRDTKTETGEVVMQFTGLHDKNGKEIYEGDVVYIDHPAWREKCHVDFLQGSFIFRALDEPSKDVVIPGYTFMRETWEVKVIGNIYSNPELIK